MTIQLIAIDIDGTLLDDDHQLSQRNADAIRAATDAGVAVVLATGRMRCSCEWLITKLGLETDGIFVQGLHITNHLGERIHGEFLAAAALDHFLPFAEQHDLSIVAFADDQVLALRRDSYTDIILKYDEPEPIVVPEISGHAVHKLIILLEPEDARELRPTLETYMGDCADVMITQPEMIEIMPTGTSKGHSLRWLAQRMGIEMADVMAIGNAENDLAMIQFAGMGVAVANAVDVVRDSADFITSSNNENGVAVAIERYVLT